MVRNDFEVKLLPHGTVGRELVITALSPLAFSAQMGGTSLQIREEEAIISGGILSLGQVFQNASTLLAQKSQLPKITPHYNDRQVMEKIKKKIKINPTDSYVDYCQTLSDWAKKDLKQQPNKWEESLSQINYSAKTITLGDPESAFSGFQPLKLEKYKYGKQFGNLSAQMDIKMDERWMALVMAGFGMAYAAFADGEIIMSMMPEEVVAKASIDLSWCNYVQSLAISAGSPVAFEFLMRFPYELRVPPDHPHAYSLLLALELGKIAKKTGYNIQNAPPYIFYRIMYTGRSFSLLERLSIDFSIFSPFVDRLQDTSIDELCKFLRCTILSTRRQTNFCEKRYGDASLCDRLSRALYEAATKVRHPADTVYLFARGSPDQSPLRNYQFLREIYDALT